MVELRSHMEEHGGMQIQIQIYYVYKLEHKTFGLAINRDYLSTVFTSDHPCPEYIVYSQYTGGLWRNQHQKQKMARPINREGTYFML